MGKILTTYIKGFIFAALFYYPPASEASREVANLTERKNPHTPTMKRTSICCLTSVFNRCPEGMGAVYGLTQGRYYLPNIL